METAVALTATKEDLGSLRTAIAKTATKDDLGPLATKDELNALTLRLDRIIERGAESQTEAIVKRVMSQFEKLITPLIKQAEPKTRILGHCCPN